MIPILLLFIGVGYWHHDRINAAYIEGRDVAQSWEIASERYCVKHTKLGVNATFNDIQECQIYNYGQLDEFEKMKSVIPDLKELDRVLPIWF